MFNCWWCYLFLDVEICTSEEAVSTSIMQQLARGPSIHNFHESLNPIKAIAFSFFLFSFHLLNVQLLEVFDIFPSFMVLYVCGKLIVLRGAIYHALSGIVLCSYYLLWWLGR